MTRDISLNFSGFLFHSPKYSGTTFSTLIPVSISALPLGDSIIVDTRSLVDKCRHFSSGLSNTVATSHMWPLELIN